MQGTHSVEIITPCSVVTSGRPAHQSKAERELCRVTFPDESARWKVRLCWLVHSAIDGALITPSFDS